MVSMCPFQRYVETYYLFLMVLNGEDFGKEVSQEFLASMHRKVTYGKFGENLFCSVRTIYTSLKLGDRKVKNT